MLRLPAFRFRSARSLAEAAAILAGEGAAEGAPVRCVAGGHAPWPHMTRRHQTASAVVSRMRCPALNGIRDGGERRLGATTTVTAIEESAVVRERYAALARAVGSISAPVLRNMGTI